MATYDVGEFLEDDAITLDGIKSPAHPDGKSYAFTSPSFETGLWLKNLIEFGRNAALGIDTPKGKLDALKLDDDEEVDLYKRVMGSTFDEMHADEVSWERVRKIFTLLLRHWGTGQDVAVSLADAAGEAAARPNRSARRASARSSSPTAGSKSSRASSATKAPTAGRASTRSSTTSAAPKRARKAG